MVKRTENESSHHQSSSLNVPMKLVSNTKNQQLTDIISKNVTNPTRKKRIGVFLSTKSFFQPTKRNSAKPFPSSTRASCRTSSTNSQSSNQNGRNGGYVWTTIVFEPPLLHCALRMRSHDRRAAPQLRGIQDHLNELAWNLRRGRPQSHPMASLTAFLRHQRSHRHGTFHKRGTGASTNLRKTATPRYRTRTARRESAPRRPHRPLAPPSLPLPLLLPSTDLSLAACHCTAACSTPESTAQGGRNAPSRSFSSYSSNQPSISTTASSSTSSSSSSLASSSSAARAKKVWWRRKWAVAWSSPSCAATSEGVRNRS